MTSTFFKHIDIPTEILRDDFIFPDQGPWNKMYFYTKILATDLHPKFIRWMEIRGFAPRINSNLILFYAHPNSATSIHTDTGGEHIWALNCQLTHGKINIRWHNAEMGERKENDLLYTIHPSNSPEIESTVLTRTTLTNISIPHSSDSMDGGWFLSLRCAPLNIKWDRLVSKLS